MVETKEVDEKIVGNNVTVKIPIRNLEIQDYELVQMVEVGSIVHIDVDAALVWLEQPKKHALDEVDVLDVDEEVEVTKIAEIAFAHVQH